MNHALSCLLLVLGLAAGCTRENAAFCCIDPADCAAQGVQEVSRLCTDGLSCVDNKCVASTCAASGCSSTAPVCDITTDVCGGCMDSTECTRFPATDVCDMTSGACVECVSAMDCGAAKPVCDAAACRTCKLDSECPSAACADDGTCVAEANVVYLSPTGTDAVPCSKAQPCLDARFAVQQTTTSRTHIVFAPGNYEAPLVIAVGSNVAAAVLSIHGGGATLTGTSDDGLLLLAHPTVMRDIQLVNTVGGVLDIQSTVTVERVRFQGMRGIGTSGTTTLREVDIRSTDNAITLNGGSINIDRSVIRGGAKGVYALAPTVVEITNLAVSGTSEIGLDLPGVTGRISFTTVADTGRVGTGPTSLACTQANLAITASILWTTDVSARPTAQGGCSITSSIVGPQTFAGAMNIDPLFVSLPSGNIRLGAGSPARDLVDTGPALDFEGDMRPRGARFDIGADEAP